MTDGRYAVLDGENVINVILWNAEDEYESSEGTMLVAAPDYVSPGWTFINGEWSGPVITEPPLPSEDPTMSAKYAAVEELMALGVSESTARIIAGLSEGETSP